MLGSCTIKISSLAAKMARSWRDLLRRARLEDRAAAHCRRRRLERSVGAWRRFTACEALAEARRRRAVRHRYLSLLRRGLAGLRAAIADRERQDLERANAGVWHRRRAARRGLQRWRWAADRGAEEAGGEGCLNVVTLTSSTSVNRGSRPLIMSPRGFDAAPPSGQDHQRPGPRTPRPCAVTLLATRPTQVEPAPGSKNSLLSLLSPVRVLVVGKALLLF